MGEFSRKELKRIFEEADISVPKDVIGQLCDLHTTSLDGLNDTVKELRANLEQAEQERDAYKSKAPKDGEETVSKSELERVTQEFEDYKAEIAKKEAANAKERAIREMYKSVGISEKRINSIMKVTNLDDYELDEAGSVVDIDKHKDAAKTEWAEFIETTSTKGAETHNPPTTNGGTSGKTKEEIMAIKDGAERRKAMAENAELFGIDLSSNKN